MLLHLLPLLPSLLLLWTRSEHSPTEQVPVGVLLSFGEQAHCKQIPLLSGRWSGLRHVEPDVCTL